MTTLWCGIMTKVRVSSLLLCLMLLTGGLLSALGSDVSVAGPAVAPPTSAPASRLIINSESDFTQAVAEGRAPVQGPSAAPVLEGGCITWTSAGPAVLVADVITLVIGHGPYWKYLSDRCYTAYR